MTPRPRLPRLALLLLIALAAPLPSASAREVRYPRAESGLDERARYPLALLSAALDASGTAFRPVPAAMPSQQARSLLALEAGQGLDVVWTMTSREREARLRAIRIPIDRGLYGWRLALIRAGSQPRFDGLAGAADFAGRIAVQGHDWPDVAVLRENGLAVVESPTYDGAFEMLARGRADWFPRAVAEIFAEQAARPALDLQVEAGFVLHYPAAMYYFVRRDDDVLAAAIERGLRALQRDGRMRRLFDAAFGDALRRADLGQRRVIELRNTQVPDLHDAGDAGLWFVPGEPAARTRS